MLKSVVEAVKARRVVGRSDAGGKRNGGREGKGKGEKGSQCWGDEGGKRVITD